MSEHLFYKRGKNKGNERQLILKTATLLVNKAGEKRIKMKVAMPLTGRKMSGTPEWITNAMTFVQQSHDIVSPLVEFKGFDIHFSDDNLFDKEGAKGSQVRDEVVRRAGDWQLRNARRRSAIRDLRGVFVRTVALVWHDGRC